MKKTTLVFLLSSALTACDSGLRVTPADSNGSFTSQSSASAKIGLPRQRQLFTSLQTCLALSDAEVSTRTKTSFDTLKSNFSAEGAVQDLNGPFMVSLAQATAEFCADRLNSDSNQTTRKFFGAFQLSATDRVSPTPTASTPKDVSIAAAELARSCWGRAPTQQEADQIADRMLQSAVGKLLDRSAALFLCTVTLTSPEILKY